MTVASTEPVRIFATWLLDPRDLEGADMDLEDAVITGIVREFPRSEGIGVHRSPDPPPRP